MSKSIIPGSTTPINIRLDQIEVQKQKIVALNSNDPKNLNLYFTINCAQDIKLLHGAVKITEIIISSFEVVELNLDLVELIYLMKLKLELTEAESSAL